MRRSPRFAGKYRDARIDKEGDEREHEGPRDGEAFWGMGEGRPKCSSEFTANERNQAHRRW